jgi:hypothetical protein
MPVAPSQLGPTVLLQTSNTRKQDRPTGNPASVEAPGRSERYNALLLHGIALHCPLLRFRIAFQNNGAEALPKIVSILSGAVEFFAGRDHGDSRAV